MYTRRDVRALTALTHRKEVAFVVPSQPTDRSPYVSPSVRARMYSQWDDYTTSVATDQTGIQSQRREERKRENKTRCDRRRGRRGPVEEGVGTSLTAINIPRAADQHLDAPPLLSLSFSLSLSHSLFLFFWLSVSLTFHFLNFSLLYRDRNRYNPDERSISIAADVNNTTHDDNFRRCEKAETIFIPSRHRNLNSLRLRFQALSCFIRNLACL